MKKEPAQLLVDCLTDVHWIEQQSLTHMKTAPEVAGEPGMVSVFRDHLEETEQHLVRLRGRLEAHGASPSRMRDAVTELGGKGFLAFARMQPDTPGRLLSHHYAWEAFEIAAYELLGRLADRAGDQATVAAARAIRDQERRMMARLATRFDAAADASLEGRERDEIEGALRICLADVHAIEAQAIQLLEKAPDLAGDPELERMYRVHLDDSRNHARWLEERLEQLGGELSTVEDLALRAVAVNWELFFQALSETPPKLAVFAFAFEHLEIAAHELLQRVARRAGDGGTIEIARRIVDDERAMAERIEASFDRALDVAFDHAFVHRVGVRTH